MVSIYHVLTTGNSSQVSDGAAAVLAMKRSVAKQMGLPVLGVLVSFAVVGVPPAVMGIGPAYAIPEALKKAGMPYGFKYLFSCSFFDGSRRRK